MHTTTFDTLLYAKKLKAAGFTDKQAEMQAEALAELMDGQLATKRDVDELKRDIKEMEMRITIKFGGMIVAAVGILATLIQLSK